jgi:serine/threonine protein kinase
MPGLTKIGEYEVQHLSTTAGVVRYEATHSVLPRRATIDVVDWDSPRTTAIHLMRQACILEALHHPGVPRVFECGIVDGRPWVAYERSTGASLAEIMRARRLDLEEVLELIEQVATILSHAHARGVLHRNVTPATIIRDPHRGHLLLADWTHACTLDTKVPAPLDATTRYRAPELIDNSRWAEGRADVFALGMIAYEALTGRAGAVGMRSEDVPVEPYPLANMIAEMLADVPALRPTAVEVVETMRTIRSSAADIRRKTTEYATQELTEKPRNKSRWTPQWSLNDSSTLAHVVEIGPRERDKH